MAQGTPVALETNGTVREALGLTSNRYSRPSLTAYWMFIRPRTPISKARAWVAWRISSIMALPRVWAGRTQAESPECTPACSICSMMPATTQSSPSHTASTSISTASSRNLSMRMGWSGLAFTAVAM